MPPKTAGGGAVGSLIVEGMDVRSRTEEEHNGDDGWRVSDSSQGRLFGDGQYYNEIKIQLN